MARPCERALDGADNLSAVLDTRCPKALRGVSPRSHTSSGWLLRLVADSEMTSLEYDWVPLAMFGEHRRKPRDR